MWGKIKKFLKQKSLPTVKILEPTINVYALINQKWLNINENLAVGLTASKIVAKHFTSGGKKISIKNSIIEVANSTLIIYCILNQLFWQNSNEQPSISTPSPTTINDLPFISTLEPNNTIIPEFSAPTNINYNNINADVLLILISEAIPWVKIILKLITLSDCFKCSDKQNGELFVWRLGESFEALFKIIAGIINCGLSGNYFNNGMYALSGVFSALITYLSFTNNDIKNSKLEKLIFSFNNNTTNEEIKKTFILNEDSLTTEDLGYLIRVIRDEQNVDFKVALTSILKPVVDEQYKISSKNDLVAILKKWLPENIEINSDFQSSNEFLPYEINAYADNENHLKELVVVSKLENTV